MQVKACQAGAFMSCSMSNSKAQRQGEQLGLQARHAYTITKVNIIFPFTQILLLHFSFSSVLAPGRYCTCIVLLKVVEVRAKGGQRGTIPLIRFLPHSAYFACTCSFSLSFY